MNIERGIRRIVIAVSVPLVVVGSSLTLYGYGRAYFVNRSLDQKINAYLNPQKLNPPPATGFIPDQKWNSYGPDEPSWNDLSNQVKNLKSIGIIGALMLGLFLALWIFYFAGRWVALGFRQ